MTPIAPFLIVLTLIFGLLSTHASQAAPTLSQGYDAFERGDVTTAVQIWSTLAEQGDTTAQVNLGQLYRQGRGVAQNDREAVKWYSMAAQQGSETAQFNLLIMQKEGRASEEDLALAFAGQGENLAAPGTGQTGAVSTTDVGSGAGVNMNQGSAAPSPPVHTQTPPVAMATAKPAASGSSLTTTSVPVSATDTPNTLGSAVAYSSTSTAPASNASATSAPTSTASASTAPGYAASASDASTSTAPGYNASAYDAPASKASASTASASNALASNASASTASASTTPAPNVPASTAPASTAPAATAPLADGEAWLWQTPARHHLLQVVASSNRARVEEYAARYLGDFQSQLHIAHASNQGRDWFILLVGPFASRDEADATLQRLPPATLKNKPWARSVQSIQKAVAGRVQD